MEKKFERKGGSFFKERRETSIREDRSPRTNDENSSSRRDSGSNGERTYEKRRSYNPNFSADNRVRGGSYNNESSKTRNFGLGERNNERGGERGNSERPFNHERRDFNRSDRPFNRERRDFNNSERPSFNRERREGGSDRPFSRERRDFNNSERPSFNRERREGGSDRPFNRERRDFNNSERPSFNRERREGGSDRPFNRERRDFNNSERPSFNRERREGGSDRPFNRERRDFNSRGDQKRDFNKTEERDENYRMNVDKENLTVESFFEQPLLTRQVRLNRYIAMSGLCSRREADEIIASGEISVNGEVVTELGAKVNPGDVVTREGQVLIGERHVYIVMNKPRGVVTTLDDPHADQTVIDLLNSQVKERVYPVGRLDKSSLGVLLLTNDGDLTTKLTHPSYNKKKIYHVFVDKDVEIEDMEMLANGIELEDGLIYADEVSYVGDSRREIGIEIHSGRNRIVRRMFEHLGYRVSKLDRVYFAGLTKKGLKRGLWRYLTPSEVSAIKSDIVK